MAAAALVNADPADPVVVQEAWQRACRVDELLSRFDTPPPSLPLVTAIIQRAQTGSQPPDAVLAGHAQGFSAPQWGAAGEVVQRQIGQLMMTVADHVQTEPKVLANVHMIVSAAAAQVSLTAWRSQAETDDLTRLRNSYALESDMAVLAARNEPVRMGFIDLNGLKKVNTAEGHEAGDRLLKGFSERLREVVHGAGGTVYRQHGDEFIAMMPVSSGHVDDVLADLLSTNEFSFSWGVAEWPTDDTEMQTVLRHADKAMYDMKAIYHKSLAEVEQGSQEVSASSAGLQPAQEE